MIDLHETQPMSLFEIVYLIKKAPWNARYLKCFWYAPQKSGYPPNYNRIETSELRLTHDNRLFDNNNYGGFSHYVNKGFPKAVKNFNPKKIGYYHTLESLKIPIPEIVKKMSLDFEEAKNKVTQLEKDFFSLVDLFK